ncbi:hypothetical protein, partial [Moraxella lacunata]|uniref:hypothetical protein n=1 Tax=Moraxella lacunata TaxID=477 RepID=UPI001C3F157D
KQNKYHIIIITRTLDFVNLRIPLELPIHKLSALTKNKGIIEQNRKIIAIFLIIVIIFPI